MIRLEQTTKTFCSPGHPAQVALEEFELEIVHGETLCLIGGSGSGKSTTLRLINRLLDPTSGRVLLEGQDIARLDPIILRRGMGYVLQHGALFPHMTVRQNVGLLCALEGWSKESIRTRVDELLERVRMPAGEFADRRPAELSGGQAQRVGVARALALDPPVLLLDEPFGALDPITRRELQEEFKELRRSKQRTILFVTHDIDEAFLLGDRVAILDRGRLLQVGTPQDLAERPASELVRRFVARNLREVYP